VARLLQRTPITLSWDLVLAPDGLARGVFSTTETQESLFIRRSSASSLRDSARIFVM
jgi:hypothetical protein